MTKLDWLLIGIVALSIVFSAIKGFTRELISLVALIWGFLLACWFYPVLERRLLPYARTADVAALTAFLAIVLAVMVAGAALSWLAGKLVQKAGLRWFDRMLGASFGLVRGLLIGVILVLALTVFAPASESLANSRLAPYLVQGARVAVAVAPKDMRERFRAWFARAQKIWNARGEI